MRLIVRPLAGARVHNQVHDARVMWLGADKISAFLAW
jgi:hypothetical protein